MRDRRVVGPLARIALVLALALMACTAARPVRTTPTTSSPAARAWGDVFLRYADRVLVGTDTWVNDRWERLPEILDSVRAWLRELPDDVARRIAVENGERLFHAS